MAAPGDTLCPRCRSRVPVDAPSEPDLFSQPAASEKPAKTRAALPDAVALNHPPHQARSATSAAAARNIKDQFPTQLEKVLRRIQAFGTTGYTRAELAGDLGMRLSSVCSAVRTLYRQGLIGSNEGETRVDPESKQRVEVLVSEHFVHRWHDASGALIPRRARSMLDGAPCDLAEP